MPAKMEHSELYCLTYVSRASASLLPSFDQEVDAIVAASAVRNRARNVTGMLVTYENWFIQAVEGPRDVIVELFEKISADPRHEDIRLAGIEPIKRRAFKAWGMRGGKAYSAGTRPALAMTALSTAGLLGLLQDVFVSEDEKESGRLGALQSLSILDTLPEQQFDDLVEVAKALTGSKIALISLVDADRQWFKAKCGLNANSTGRDVAFCDHTIRSSSVMWVEDATRDARFADNPLVTGDPHIRFYAGAPLQVAGHNIGTLCVIDDSPKAFNPMIAEALAALGRAVAARLEARKDERIAASLLATATDAIVCADSAGKIAFWNAAAERMFGWRSSEALGRPLDILAPERRKAACNAALESLRRTGEAPMGGRSLELPALRKDGTEFPIEVALAVWGSQGQMGTGCIIRDCSERKAAEHALATAKTAAEAANVAKSAFLANMSHEIRTPLNGVLGMSQAIAAGELSPLQRDRLEVVLRSGQNLLGILNDVLDLSKIEAGHLEIEAISFSLENLVTDVQLHFEVSAAAKGLRLGFDLSAELSAFYSGDAGRIRQVLFNLMSNAVKFTAAGLVELKVSCDGDRVFFCVTDSGEGISEEALPRLFQAFTQADASTTRRHGGTGLGLAVSRQLARKMGGDVNVVSQLGVGSSFTLQLPLKPLSTTKAGSEASARVAPQSPTTLRILAAEDNPTNQLVLRTLLAQEGVELFLVENGAEALHAWRGSVFDLILMDIQMPVMDGLAAVRQIRTEEARLTAARTPILAVTANVMNHQLAEYRDAGMDGYVSKPIDVACLFSALNAALHPADGAEAA